MTNDFKLDWKPIIQNKEQKDLQSAVELCVGHDCGLSWELQKQQQHMA